MLGEVARWAIGAGLIVVLAVAAGACAYAGVSFLFARRHLPPRPFLIALSQLVREALLAMLVTLLSPVYAFVGRRMGGPASGTPIVLVHGYTQNRADFVVLARALDRAGLGPVYGFNYWSLADVRRSARRLARFVRRVCRAAGVEKVDLVGHSMGGIVVVECMLRMPEHVRRCVTIASPHRGVLWRGPFVGKGAAQLRAGASLIDEHEASAIGVPLLSIASSHDNLVHPASRASVAHRGGKDLVVAGPGHLALLFDARVIDATIQFLRGTLDGDAPRDEDRAERALHLR